MISARARALVLALDDQAWKGPGYLDYAKKCEIVQAALDSAVAFERFKQTSLAMGQADGDAWDDPQAHYSSDVYGR